KLMNAVSNSIGAKFIDFLQPTMGLEGVQSSPTYGTRDDWIFGNIPPKYIYMIRQHYASLKKECKELDFCVDISDVAPPVGNLYAGPRHHNANGNWIIAQGMFRHLKDDFNPWPSQARSLP